MIIFSPRRRKSTELLRVWQAAGKSGSPNHFPLPSQTQEVLPRDHRGEVTTGVRSHVLGYTTQEEQ